MDNVFVVDIFGDIYTFLGLFFFYKLTGFGNIRNLEKKDKNESGKSKILYLYFYQK